MKIDSIRARSVFDSQGFLTLEAVICLQDGREIYGAAPRGSTKGAFETEISEDFRGANISPGLCTATKQFNDIIAPALTGTPVDYKIIDDILVQLRDNYKVGANCTVAASYAAFKATAAVEHVNCYELLNPKKYLTVPIFNIIDGLKAPFSKMKGIEILLIPKKLMPYTDITLIASDIFHTLQNDLWNENYKCDTGPQGALTPDFQTLEVALDFLCKSMIKMNKNIFDDFILGLDMATSDIYKSDKYNCKFINGREENFEQTELLDYYKNIINKFPIKYIEDGFSDTDYNGWNYLLATDKSIICAGDDITASNIERISFCIDNNLINGVVIKPNQIGTISEAYNAICFAKNKNINTLISQRTGETEDTIIAHLALGSEVDMIKVGAPNRLDRISKCNEMIRISEKINLF